MSLKIFVGSANEGHHEDREVRKIIESFDFTPIPWRDTFLPGEFGLASLERLSTQVDGAILIATPDDKIWYRGAEGLTPRDNVLFELGFFIKALGRNRVGLVVVRNIKGEMPKIPSDLAGLNFIYYDVSKEAHNQTSISKWLFQLQKHSNEISSEFENPLEILRANYSKLPTNWKDDIKNYIIEPFKKQSIDALSGEFTLSVAQYYNSLLHSIETSTDTTKIRAISVLSHEFWEDDPHQVQYLNYNINAKVKGVSIKRLFVVNRSLDPKLWRTIRRQLENGIEIKVVDPKLFSSFSKLDDLVIFEDGDNIRSYVSLDFFSDSKNLRAANLILNMNTCKEQIISFDALWELARPATPTIVEKINTSCEPPGLKLKPFNLTKEVISCEEAAQARGVSLVHELKTMILSTEAGYCAVHVPGDGKISLRSVKRALNVEEAFIASPDELYKLKLSEGTVSAILNPVWGMKHLISKRVLTLDYVTTNNGTRSQYFKFDPIILLQAESTKMGDFEK